MDLNIPAPGNTGPQYGPRGATSRRLLALAVGESCTFRYLERATVTGLARYWRIKKGVQFVTRRDRKDRSRLRVWRVT